MADTFTFEEATAPTQGKTFSFDEAQEPHTTAGGIAGSLARGAAPYAAGAAAGAALGAPFLGVGAVPGAALGAGAVGLTQGALGLWNLLAHHTGLPAAATPQEATDKLMDYIGQKRPSTTTERYAESLAGGVAGGASGAAGAAAAGDLLPGAVGTAAKALAKQPGRQVVAGATGAAASQTAAEAGLGPAAQTLAGLAGAGVASVRGGAGPARPAAVNARQAGYVLPPASISDKPGLVSNVLAGWSGKIKTQQAASAKNQEVTNGLAAEALGLPKDTVLTDQVLQNVRQQAGQTYQTVINSVPVIHTDTAWDNAVAGLGGKNSHAAKMFPKIVGNPGIQDMVDELQIPKDIPTGTAVELVKELRFNANANLKAIGDPSKHALGLAQREAADAMDDLMDRNITASGQPGVIDAYREARKTIAKAYDVEGATNTTTGDVNARALGRLMDKGRPLTDQLKTIADAALAFPKAMQTPAGFGDNEAWSGLDFFGAAAATAHGNPGVAGAILARPVARGAVLSNRYQNAITKPGGSERFNPLPLALQPGMTPYATQDGS